MILRRAQRQLLVPLFLWLFLVATAGLKCFFPPPDQGVIRLRAPISEIDHPVLWMWCGALRSTSVQVKARLQGPCDAVRLWVALDPLLANPRRSPAQRVSDGDPPLHFDVQGLEADSRYYYGLAADGVLDRGKIGCFRTLAEGSQSFTFALGSCAITGSSSPVFRTIAEQDPLFFLHMGDLHYENIGENKPQRYAEAYGWVLRSRTQAELYRSCATVYIWDDHDYGRNNSDAESVGRAAARRTYQDFVPHYPLAAGSGDVPIYQAFSVGRVRFVVSDVRSERSSRRDPDDHRKSMLGATQTEWLKRELLAAQKEHALVVWVSSVSWLAPPKKAGDHWGGYTTERQRLAQWMVDQDLPSLLVVSGDAHMLAMDDGRNNSYVGPGQPGFPAFQAAALDNRGSVKGGPFSVGTLPGGGQFGLVQIEDDGGAEIRVQLLGMDLHGHERMRLEFSVAARRGS
jgi:alkaline phosphatase D